MKDKKKYASAHDLRLVKGDLVEIAGGQNFKIGIVIKGPRTWTDTVRVILLYNSQLPLLNATLADDHFIGEDEIILPMDSKFRMFRRLVPAEKMHFYTKKLKEGLVSLTQ